MVKAYQYRIYPTKEQTQTLETQLEACKNIYNQALAWRRSAYEENGESVTYGTQQAALTPLRAEKPFWATPHIDILQDTLRRLDKAFKAFFRRVKNGENPGYPRFKGKGRYRSITFSHLSPNLIREIGGRLARLAVPKMGNVKIRYHRPLPEGKVKTLTIQRKASGWYANITVQVPDAEKAEPVTAVGVDVGLESFLTTSEGEHVENPRHLRQSEAKLKRKQRRVSKRKKGSHRRQKAVHELAKQHEHIVNQRRDFHCKTAHQLYARYDAVVVEDLQITNMVKNHHLAKSISDAAWGNFILACTSKAENAGKYLLKVPPHGTSQICSGCGEVVKKSLATRVHRCNSCGLVIDRDHNAAINILRVASPLRGGMAVVNAPDETRNHTDPWASTSPRASAVGS
ncbi:MAG: transposase [Candidatus Poribacteria bacterium]|nr:transposase [Candidatus Poribacteria bacterium]